MFDFSTKERSQFIQQLEEFVAETEKVPVEDEAMFTPDEKQEELQKAEVEKQPADELDLSGDEMEQAPKSDIDEKEKAVQAGQGQTSQAEQLEQVMNHGMQFLAGMFKMSTGKDMRIENQTVEVNKETGEVTMKFKLPVIPT